MEWSARRIKTCNSQHSVTIAVLELLQYVDHGTNQNILVETQKIPDCSQLLELTLNIQVTRFQSILIITDIY